MLSNETITKRHRTHSTVTKKEVGRTKQKDDQSQDPRGTSVLQSLWTITEIRRWGQGASERAYPALQKPFLPPPTFRMLSAGSVVLLAATLMHPLGATRDGSSSENLVLTPD